MRFDAIKLRAALAPLIPLVVVAAASEFAVKNGLIPAFLFPAPSQVLLTLIDDFDLFKTAFLQTFQAAALGFLLSLVLGLMIALLLSFSTTIRRMFYPYAIFFQTVPIIAIAPLLVIWLGYGLPTVVASAFIVSIFPVIANSVMGLLSTDPQLVDLFRMMDASRSQNLFLLRFPYALPQILGGAKIAAGLAVIGAIVGEFISGTGLGGVVDSARTQQRVDRVFAAVLLAALLGILFFSMISLVNHFILKRWRRIS